MAVFLLNRLAFRVTDFFHHWYVGGSRSFGNGLRYTEGFPGRWGRVLGYPAHFLAAAALGLLYFLWLLIPIFILYQIFLGQK